MYHGWADPLVTPDASLIMFKQINEDGWSLGREFARAVHGPGNGALPGRAGHRRVRQGRRDRSVGGIRCQAAVNPRFAHDAGGVDRTRPLCAYPATARYVGSGSTDEARNFRCENP
jgi:feruloyl esterase